MKFNILLTLSALLATAVAQGLGDLPDCSKECATGAIPQNCGIDIKCICEAKSFLSDVSCCVAQKCSKADQETTLKAARSLCARGGVTDLPTAVVCSSSASSSSSSTSSSTETGTTTGTEASAATKTDGTTVTTGTKASTTNNASSSASASSSAAATSTGVAGINHKDSSLVAAAGAAAAFAILI